MHGQSMRTRKWVHLKSRTEIYSMEINKTILHNNNTCLSKFTVNHDGKYGYIFFDIQYILTRLHFYLKFVLTITP